MEQMHKISAVVFLLFALHLAYGQNITRDYNVTPVTPEAAALAKMVNYPVNHNTGIPNISIPLYEIKTGGMVLPIELNYHSGGFKINEQAGRAGLGWSLSCDLQITRTINGLDDFEPGNGYIANTLMKYANKESSISQLYDYPIWDQRNAYNLAMGFYDGMPDKFYYKLLNKSGSFFFRKNENGNGYAIVPVPFDNIKIKYANGVFEIVDTDGTTYYFGDIGTLSPNNHYQYGIETSGSSLNEFRRTTWKCMRIDNANFTETISFTYSNQDEKCIKSYQDKIEYWNTFIGTGTSYYADESMINGITRYDQLLEKCRFYELSSPKYMEYYAGDKKVFHLPYIERNTNQVIDKAYEVLPSNSPTHSFTYIRGITLTRITYRGGKVDFVGNKVLNNIEISDNGELKKIQLFQSDVTPIHTAQTDWNYSKTNYLDSICIGGDTYTFLYRDRYCFGNHLKGHDAWGYVNERTVERVQITSPTIGVPRQYKKIKHRDWWTNIIKTFDFGGSDIKLEQPNEEYMQKGILKRIVYPTGGFVDFDFEANKYEEKHETNLGEGYTVLRNGGGLRIRSINYCTGDTYKASLVKYYRYGDYEEGAGLVANAPAIYNVPGYVNVWGYKGHEYTQIINYSQVNSSGPVLTVGMDSLAVYLPASALDCSYPSGAPIYYTKVTEYQMDMGVQSGKTVYKYFPRDNFLKLELLPWAQMVEDTNIPYVKTDWFIGALESVSEYKYEKGKFRLSHLKKNEYNIFQTDERPRVVYSFPFEIHQAIYGTIDETERYKLYNCKVSQYSIPIGRLLLVKETEKWLENASDTIIQTTNYFYDDYLQPKTIIKSHSSGSRIIALKYPYDEAASGNVYAAMKTMNMVSPIIEETIKDSNMEISRVRSNYRMDGTKVVRSHIESSIQGGPLTEELRFDLYDPYENVLQTTSRSLAVKSFLWGYQGRYLVAEIENASYSTASSLLNMGIINNPSSENTIKTELEKLYQISYAMVNAYTYKPLAGILRHISPQKLHTTYGYDTYGRLKSIKDNREKVLKTFDYKSLKASYYSGYLYDTNIPRIESYNIACGTGQMGIYNNFYFGGQEISSYTPMGISEEYDADCTPESGFARVTLWVPNAISRDVVFDFVKDDRIYTKTVYITSWYGMAQQILYLPVGEYSVVFKSGAQSYDEKHYLVELMASVGEGRLIGSKDKVNIQSGITYSFTVR